MVRSMYSGVTGMKAHQTRLDVIGNNIANVNTYGFKSSRATFRDVYYQSLRNAAAPTGSTGGTNPSGVGYGSSIASVDLLMTQSTVTNTGNPMDIAINGDGFFQVQDADGNTFYTRAGMLDIDADGNLVDMNGYFVLGVAGSPVGQPPASNKINILNSMGSVPATAAHITSTINDKKITIQAQNATTEGNISINFVAADDLPIGQKAEAIVGTSNIQVKLNSKETFAGAAELSQAVNNAITQANNGTQHPAGQFTITFDPDSAFAGQLTGAQICGTNYGYDYGSIKFPKDGVWGFTFDSVGSDFAPDIPKNGEMTFTLERRIDNPDDDEFVFTATAGSNVYTGTVKESQMQASGKLLLTNNGSETDFIAVNYPTYSSLMGKADPTTLKWNDVDADIAGIQSLSSSGGLFGGITVTGIPDAEAGEDASLTYADGNFTLTIAGYTNATPFTKNDCGKNVILTKGTGDTATTITAKIPSYEKLVSACDGSLAFEVAPTVKAEDITPSTPSQDLGLSSSAFKLVDGTEGGAVETKDLTGIIIGADGVIVATHPILGQKEVGRIDLANFNNSAALIQSGNSYYEASANSGTAGLSTPGTGGTGGLKTSSLELSNVDLSQEFADMITTQRGFQANSRMITVSDTLLEELVNLKR